MIWIAFGVGLFVGTWVGIFTLGLCQLASRQEEMGRLEIDPELYEQTTGDRVLM